MEENNEKKLTELSQLGEFGLIDRITKDFEIKNDSTIFGVGDDAAVVSQRECELLITTDLLIEGIHFDLTYTPLKHLGYKAVAVNLSDVYAMNGTPKQITVSIGLSSRFSLEAIEELYAGIKLACNRYGVDLIGGDTSSSQKGLIISVTALGEAKKEDIVYRHGARENDLICVSGDLGGAFIGLQLLEREKLVFMGNPKVQPKFEERDYVLERQLKPEARGDVIAELKKLGVKPTAMIDISDGLSSELLHVCERSQMGCQVYEERLPIDVQTIEASEEMNYDPTICAMNGGEDYELLFTVSIADFEKVKGNKLFSIIGHITANGSGANLISRDGTSVPIKAQGWNSFAQ